MRIILIILTTLLASLTSGGINAQQCDTLKICMIGDIMMHSRQIELACAKDSTYDFSSYFHAIKDSLTKADICIANMEFTLAGKPYTGYPTFSAPDTFMKYLASCGMDVLLCSNNHIYDKGSAGATRTLKTIHELAPQIRTCGLSTDSTHLASTTPLTISKKGMKISLVNFTYGTNAGADRHWPKANYMSNKKLITNALRRASTSDLTLVLPHWGEEYVLTPSEGQRNTAKWLIENGADLIIGTHPHVPQGCEIISGVQVAYSLGNAVSNMSAPNTQLELMAQIRLVKHPGGKVELLPINFTYLWCSRPGGLGPSYTVIPIKAYLDKKYLWKGTWDYDKMTETYKRVKDIIKIEDR